ncbi:MAG: hypothetical protein PHX08_21980, partial [Lachnospiraceae bacterium]|nr:hypothetical protein [Lachnospiraceae bacterium]
MIKNVGKKIVPYLEYVLCFMLILEGNSIFVSVTDSDNAHFFQMTSIVLIILLILVKMIIQGRNSINKLRDISMVVCILFIYSAYFMCRNVIYTGNSETFVTSFLLFLPLLILLLSLYAEENNEWQLVLRISDIMVVIALISLFFWIFAVCGGMIVRTGKVRIEWGWSHYASNFYNLYFVNPAQYGVYFGMKIFRNTAIFPESPMFNIFLTIALYGELFLRKKSNKMKVILFAGTILTTFGTMGYMLLAIGLFLKYVDGIKDIKRYKKQIMIASIAATALLAVLLVHKMTAGAGSSSVRVDDYAAGIKAWLTAPFFGTGFGNKSVIVSFMSAFRDDNLGYSNSVFSVLAEGGAVLFLIYLIPFFSYFICFFTKKEKRVCYFGIGMFVLFMTTIFEYRLIMMMILAYGYIMLDKLISRKKSDKTANVILHESRDKTSGRNLWGQVAVFALIAVAQMMCWIKILILWNSGVTLNRAIGSLVVIVLLSFIIITLSNGQQSRAATVSEGLCAIFLIAYVIKNQLLNFIRTMLQLAWMYTQLEQRRFLLVVTAVILLSILLVVIHGRLTNKIIKEVMVIVVFLGIAGGSFLFNGRINEYLENSVDESEWLKQMASSDIKPDSVYVDDVPYILQQLCPDYHIIGGIPQRKTDQSVVFASEEEEVPELLEQDFLCGE